MPRHLALVLLGCCLAIQGQEPTYHTQSPLVVAPVTVTSRDGSPVWGLTEADFKLLDNGQERVVRVEPWNTYQSAISLVVVIETCGISKAALQKVKKTGAMLDEITGEGGEVAVVTADYEATTALGFTTHWEPIQETFERLKAHGGNGRVLDGVAAAVDLLANRPKERRRLILLLSEARDRGSKVKAKDVLTRAQQENITIYTATYSAYVTPFTTKASNLNPGAAAGLDLIAVFREIAQAAKKNAGAALAEYTGGRHLSFETLHKLEDDLTEIGKEVHSQYLLSFTPPADSAAVYHSLEVKVKGHDDVVVRARPGYWSVVSEKN